jgi:hypothetical protein
MKKKKDIYWIIVRVGFSWRMIATDIYSATVKYRFCVIDSTTEALAGSKCSLQGFGTTVDWKNKGRMPEQRSG